MIVLDRDVLHLVATGKATQVRLTSHPRDVRRGQTHNVKRNGGEPVCRVRVVDLRAEHLDEASDEDAQREGHRNRAALLHAWRLRLGEPVDGLPTYVVRLDLVREAPAKLLSRGTRRTADERGYTDLPHLAIVGDPGEAVDDATQAVLTERARQRFEAEQGPRIARQKARAQAARLKEAQRRAEQAGVDVEAEVESIAAAVESIEAKVEQAREAA